MRPIRILHLSGTINRGDAIDTIIRHIDRDKIEVYVATFTPKSLIADTEYDAIGIPHLRLSSKYNHSYLDYLFSIFKLYSFSKKHRIDVIHSHLFWDNMVATVTEILINVLSREKTKLIVHRHYTHDIDNLRGYKKSILKKIESISYNYADSIIAPTMTIKKVIDSDYDKHISEKVRVIPYCFDFNADKYRLPDRDEILDFRRRMGVEDAFVVVNVGSHRWQKGQHILMRAFAEFLRTVPNARLWLVGSGPQTKAFMELSRSLNLGDGERGPCKFWGFRPADQVRFFIAAADLFVHPTFSEAFPQVMVETLVLGTPLIITPVSGAVDYLEHGKHAWFVPIDDANSLTEAMITLWKNPELRAHMSKNGRELILERFTFQKVLSSYTNLYSQLCSVVSSR